MVAGGRDNGRGPGFFEQVIPRTFAPGIIYLRGQVLHSTLLVWLWLRPEGIHVSTLPSCTEVEGRGDVEMETEMEMEVAGVTSNVIYRS